MYTCVMNIAAIQKKAVHTSSVQLKLLSIKPSGKELKIWHISIQSEELTALGSRKGGGGGGGGGGGSGSVVPSSAALPGLMQLLAGAAGGGGGGGAGGGLEEIKAHMVKQLRQEMEADAQSQLEKSVTKIEGRLLAGFQMLKQSLDGRLGKLDTCMKKLDARVAVLEKAGAKSAVQAVGASGGVADADDNAPVVQDRVKISCGDHKPTVVADATIATTEVEQAEQVEQEEQEEERAGGATAAGVSGV
jgi:hypothetical protein